MNYRAAIIDVDGTVVRGDEPIAGGADGLAAIDRAGVQRLFVSNNPTKLPEAYESRLSAAGYDVDRTEVLTAGTATTAYLRAEHPAAALFVVGESALERQFNAAGLTLTTEPTAADAFVASIDYGFEYDDLRDALVVLEDSAVPFVGTDPDVVIPTSDGVVPGSGAIIGAIATVVGREPDVICGKPSEHTVQMAIDRLGDVHPRECLVVGDRLDTDIRLGERAGMTTVLVKTGVTDNGALDRSSIEPDYVLESIGEIDRVLDGQ
ncbi:MAG: HAD-IIA family hydrolase [Halobacteriota archaeon]